MNDRLTLILLMNVQHEWNEKSLEGESLYLKKNLEKIGHKYYQTGYKRHGYVDYVKCLLAWFGFIKIWVKEILKLF